MLHTNILKGGIEVADSVYFNRGILKDPKASIAERILSLLFRRQEIPARFDKDKLYMRRFFVFPAIAVLGIWERYLHVFYRSDEDPDPHCHPFAFKTRVLLGGYVDENWTCKQTPDGYSRKVTNFTVMERGDSADRPATYIHRVHLIDPTKRTWTLVARSSKVRSWFFYTVNGPVGHKEYLRE